MNMKINRRTSIEISVFPVSIVSKAVSAGDILPSLKLMLRFPAGGPSDVTARVPAEKLSGNYARTVVVDNKPGAAKRPAAQAVNITPPDRRTIFITSAPVVRLLPHVFANMLKSTLTDLAPVSRVCDFVHDLAVDPAVPEYVQTL